jgi:hypothetical protein
MQTKQSGGAGCDCHHTAPKIIRTGFLSCCSVIAVIYSKPCRRIPHLLCDVPLLVFTHLPGVALHNHIPSSSRGTAQSFFLCGAAHAIILPWHCSMIFLVWSSTSHLPGVVLHIPSSLRGTAHSFLLTTLIFLYFFIFLGDFLIFFVLYSALLRLPPLRFHCADGCWDRTQDRCN